MRSRIAALALTMSLGFAAPASASTQFTFLSAGSVSAFGYFVGPYTGYQGAPANNVIDKLNCVDFFHHVVQSPPSVWNANLTNLGSSTGIGSVTRFSGLALYQQAAWLSKQFATAPTSEYGNIQAAIWTLFAPQSGPLPANVNPTPNTWLAQAAAGYSTLDVANYWVVSDVRTHTIDDASAVQEFIIYDDTFNPNVTPTPEPATLMLVATGIAGIAGVRIRRRKK
jgi:hypothetical protein